MKTDIMDIDKFKEYIDLYSADLSRWPAVSIAAARKLIETSVEARTLFDRELAAMDLLARYTPEMPDLKIMEENILARTSLLPRRAPFMTPPSWRKVWLFAPSGGAMAAALAGFIVGMQPQAQTADLLVDPVFYAEEAIIGGNNELYNGEIF